MNCEKGVTRCMSTGHSYTFISDKVKLEQESCATLKTYKALRWFLIFMVLGLIYAA